MIGAIAIACLVGGLIVTVVYAACWVGKEESPSWAEYQWGGDE